ncbi:hypothetical protein AYK26_05380 [Euryarchaeota archaeon SM23-78]|nr:MAG: hypothetical protein AYK26_05380 [Euryarchaeota archaeon SM23-78]MBW3000978.1 hypothetical protein [Candidatus Woesearchaeota archaeon]
MELERVGLTQNESKVYLALLDLGSSLAGKISEKAGIHRRAVYDALNRLIEKGLVSYVIKSGKKFYEATNPEKILDVLKEKEEDIKQKEEVVKTLLPELFARYKATKSELSAAIYRGKGGLKTVMELILKEKKDWLSIGSTGKGPQVIPYFLPGWHRRRCKLKIKYKGLIADTSEGRKRAKELSKTGLAEHKFLPKNIHHLQTTWVFGSKVAIILVSVEQPIIFLIDNKEIADSFRGQFKWLWEVIK